MVKVSFVEHIIRLKKSSKQKIKETINLKYRIGSPLYFCLILIEILIAPECKPFRACNSVVHKQRVHELAVRDGSYPYIG